MAKLLSERLEAFRTDRPSEWMMDEFMRYAQSLESELKAREWISVDDRLPEDGFYLIYANSYSYKVTSTANLLTRGWIVDPDVNVTHWQPLPASPITEKES